MKRIIIIATMAASFLFGGCGTSRHIPTQVQEQKRDSMRVEYREHVIFVPDTVYVEIPPQTAERTTADSVSHLENDYASSDARLNFDGTLTHTLFTKPQTMSVPTERKIECRDSIVYRDRVIKGKETVTEYVEHKLSWWERTQIYGFWAAIILVAVCYRKKIFQAVVRRFLIK